MIVIGLLCNSLVRISKWESERKYVYASQRCNSAYPPRDYLYVLGEHVVGVQVDVLEEPGSGEVEGQLHFVFLKHCLVPANPAGA